MLTPSPVSLLCTLLLCLPLALIFTVSEPPATADLASAAAVAAVSDSRRLDARDPNGFRSSRSRLTHKKFAIARTTTAAASPPPHPAAKAADLELETAVATAEEEAVAPPWVPSEEDEREDELLLRAAARAKRKPSEPRKVAFMFLTTTPLPTAPLWELFFGGGAADRFNIYVHADPSFAYAPPFGGVFSGRVIPSKPTRRFTPSLTAAARRLLARALLHDRGNAVFVLLSASCIPLHSFNFTYRTLTRSRRSFIEILKNQTESYGRWAARGESAMLPEVSLEDFRIGSQFFALTRRHSRVVVKDRRLWRKFALPCETTWTCYPEENYFPTLLSKVDPQGCENATLTHVDWRGRSDGHPHTYEPSEVGPELIRRLRDQRPRYGDDDDDLDLGFNGTDSSGAERRRLRRHPFLFARKFGEDTVQPLMSVASDVILKD